MFAAIGKRGNLTELSTRGFGASLLLAEFSFASPKAVAFEREDLGVVGEAVDERDGARGVGEDGVPALERQIGGHQDRAMLVATTDDLKEEVRGAGIVREISDLIDGEQCGPGIVLQAAVEGPRGFLPVEIEEEVRGGREARGVAGQHGGVHDVLGEHGLAEALRPDEQHIVGEREKVEGEDPFEGAAVQGGGPVPIPVGHWFEAAEARGGEAAFDAAALPVLELGGDDAFEQHGGTPAPLGGLGDEVVEVVGGARPVEPAQVTRQARRGRVG